MEKVFVYGTLRKGWGNHRLLRHLNGVPAVTENHYSLYARRIPFVHKNPVSPIVGEVYEVDERTLESLDRLEGHPRWYVREEVPVVLETGEVTSAWLYFNDSEDGQLIESGDFADYTGSQGLSSV